MQLRVYLNYRFYEPDKNIKNEWAELKQWKELKLEEQEVHSWPWIQHVKSDKLESGSNAVYVGTMIPGGTVFSLRKVILEKLRLRDVEMMPKKVFNSDDWWWNENEGPRKKRGGNATPNTKEVEKVHIYAAGTDIELTDDEQKIHNRDRFTVAVYLKKKNIKRC